MLALFGVKQLSNNFISGCIVILFYLVKLGKVFWLKIVGIAKVLDDIQIVIY